MQTVAIGLIVALLGQGAAAPKVKPRARDLGIPFTGKPGPFNAITDVPGVTVGMTTLIEGGITTPFERGKDARPLKNDDFAKMKSGEGPIRTGVTAIFPRGRDSRDSCYAGLSVLNGNGEMTGSHWIEESGFLDGPVLITNTSSVGVVRDATLQWQAKEKLIPYSNSFTEHVYFSMPVVAETADVGLNDMNGFHIKPEHAVAALNSAKSGPVAEGNVGGGTGMVCHGWKGGTGTASRKIGPYTVGVLVQANHGAPNRLSIAGIPLAAELMPRYWMRGVPPGTGSIIIIVATDAPLLPMQLKRVAKRAALGVGRLGGIGENSSGDIILAFSTANPGLSNPAAPNAQGLPEVQSVKSLRNDQLDILFESTIEATEEAIVNVLCAAETMTGIGGFTIEALPMDKVTTILRKHGRIK